MTVIRQIQSPKKIKNHLLLVYQIQPRITIRYTSDTTINISRFIYTHEQPDEILLKTNCCQMPASTTVNLSYFFDGYEHFFESRILSFKPANSTVAFLKINLPAAIRAVNRRSYLRLYPDSSNSIQVKLDSPNHSPVSCSVQDISTGGFSFLMPFNWNKSIIKANMEIELNLLDDISFRATATLRNMLKCNNELRIGAEFSNISKNNKDQLTDYLVNCLIENRLALTKRNKSQSPVICLIQDNCRGKEDLDYLARPYQLVRQDLNSDWRLLSSVTPDAILFNLSSISPIMLLEKIKNLENIKKSPAIILAENEFEPACDATVLCGLRDPAMLLEAIECAITPGILPKIQSIKLKKKNSPNVSTPNTCPMILMLDLKEAIPSKIVAAIESRNYAALVVNRMAGILETIKNHKPRLIVITAEIDTTCTNFLRMLEINKHTRKMPLVILTDPTNADGTDRLRNSRLNINFLPENMESEILAQQFIEIISPPENDSSNRF